MQPSLAEVLILHGLLVAHRPMHSGSASAEWSASIRAAKPDSDLDLRVRSRRASAGFVWEVLLQGKVICERPLPGIAHAFVFWGFCAFALITVNHIAAGFGLTLIPRDSAFGASISDSSRYSRCGGGLDRGSGCPPLCRAAHVAGEGIRRIGRDRAIDFPPDGHVSRRRSGSNEGSRRQPSQSGGCTR